MVNKQKLDNFLNGLKQGFLMGAAVGITVGGVIGAMTVLTVGPAPGKTYVSTVGRHMLQTGAWMGAIMSLGSVLRGEEVQQTMEYKRMPVYISSYPKIGLYK